METQKYIYEVAKEYILASEELSFAVQGGIW
jgi:hypothetical protein